VHDTDRRSRHRIWLVTGGCGQLGSHVLPLLRSRREAGEPGAVYAVCTGRHEGGCTSDEAVDLLEAGAVVRLLRQVRPSHILHLAAVSSPAIAERDSTPAWRLNGAVTALLSHYATRTDGWLGFSSSDFVFDGTTARPYREGDRAAPVNVYGRTKLAGETAVLADFSGAVVRLSLLYGPHPNGRGSTITRQLTELAAGRTVDIVCDEIRTPLALPDAAAALVRLGEMGHRGLVHLGGPDAVTPAGMLAALSRDVGIRCRIRRIRRTQLPCPRPGNVSLDSTLIKKLIPDLRIGPIPGLRTGRKTHVSGLT
jgi:dTDP-4-dehydrorhamnose reductase